MCAADVAMTIQCTSCQKWVHRKRSGINGSMYKVMKAFVCRRCMNTVTSTGCTNVDIADNTNLELVDRPKFCYLGDMLSAGVQICISPSRCHCHSLSLATVNPDWFYLPGFTTVFYRLDALHATQPTASKH